MAGDSSSPRRAVVTGGAGFVGSHVVDAFLEAGYEVLTIDDLSTGDPENVNSRASLVQLDIVDTPSLRKTVTGFEPAVVCHLAAQSSVTASVAAPEHDFGVNVRGTFNVCEAAREVGASIVFASTGGALYGDRAPLPTPEETPPEPLSPYGASKLAGEAYVATWGRLHQIQNAVLRLGNVYGPRQNAHGEAGVVAIFSDRLIHDKPPVVYGDGTQTRDFVHVADVARAFVLAAEAKTHGTFNVGTGEESSVLRLLEVLRDVSGRGVSYTHEPPRPGELKRSALGRIAIEQALGWRPSVSLETGLAETFRWYASR
jgi:UDP-glucose 4-epimerase